MTAACRRRRAAASAGRAGHASTRRWAAGRGPRSVRRWARSILQRSRFRNASTSDTTTDTTSIVPSGMMITAFSRLIDDVARQPAEERDALTEHHDDADQRGDEADDDEPAADRLEPGHRSIPRPRGRVPDRRKVRFGTPRRRNFVAEAARCSRARRSRPGPAACDRGSRAAAGTARRRLRSSRPPRRSRRRRPRRRPAPMRTSGRSPRAGFRSVVSRPSSSMSMARMRRRFRPRRRGRRDWTSRVVAHAPQQPVDDARRAPPAAGDRATAAGSMSTSRMPAERRTIVVSSSVASSSRAGRRPRSGRAAAS